MKRIPVKGILVAALCMAVLISGCSKKDGQKQEKKLRLAFVAGGPMDFWTFAQRGCQKADRELEDVEVQFRFTSGGTAAEQRRLIDDLLVSGIDGIVMTPLDPINQRRMVNEVAKQIPVLITDSDVPNSDRLCYIGTNNVDAGREAGKLIKELLPKGGDIMLFVGKKDAQNAKERIEGVKEELKGTRINIIDIRTDDVDLIRAKANATDTLVKYPDVSCLVGLWSYNGPCILNAVKDAGKLDKVKIVCFDEEDDAVSGVKDGYIYGTIVQQPFEFGYQSIHLLAKVVKGDESAIPADRNIIIPTKIIKQEQAAEFLKKIQALRRGDY